MTENEWMKCTDPQQMLAFLDGKASNRKFWLWACGCCRQHPNLMADSRCRNAVETGERYAEGKANAEELMEASEEAFCRRTDLAGNQLLEAMSIAAAFSVVDPADRDSALPPITTASAVQGTSEDLIHLTTLSVAVPHNTAATEKARQEAAGRERAAHCRLIRCVIGDPFRLVTIDPAWLAWNDHA